jgi:hypothetical protein
VRFFLGYVFVQFIPYLSFNIFLKATRIVGSIFFPVINFKVAEFARFEGLPALNGDYKLYINNYFTTADSTQDKNFQTALLCSVAIKCLK